MARGQRGEMERRRAALLVREARELTRAMTRLAYLIGRAERRRV